MSGDPVERPPVRAVEHRRITRAEYEARIEAAHRKRMQALDRREDGDRATPWLEPCHPRPWLFGKRGLV